MSGTTPHPTLPAAKRRAGKTKRLRQENLKDRGPILSDRTPKGHQGYYREPIELHEPGSRSAVCSDAIRNLSAASGLALTT